MTRQLFRTEATLALRDTLATATVDRQLIRPLGIAWLLGLCASALFAAGFVHISLGATAAGVLRSADRDAPVIAERGGLLMFTISERAPIAVDKEETVARIRNLDLATLTGGPNTEFSKDELNRRRHRLKERIEEKQANDATQLRESARVEAALVSLAGQIEDLIPIYRVELNHLQDELETKQSLFAKGLVRKDEVNAIRNLLTEREVQLRESKIRLADLEHQLAQVRMGRAESVEIHGREQLALENALADVERRLQAEADIQTIDVKVSQAGTLIPRGFTAGQVIKAGDVLFGFAGQDSGYVVEADVPAGQIGDVEKGAAVKIAISAYPYFEYGFIDGRVEHVSHAPNEAITFSGDLPRSTNFRLVIRPDADAFRRFRAGKTLMPGMDATVHIRREKVAAWRLFLAPLLRLQERISA